MVVGRGQKVISVSCQSCDWSERWYDGENGLSQCHTSIFNEDGGVTSNKSSNEKSLFGKPRIPKQCPVCGSKTTQQNLPVNF